MTLEYSPKGLIGVLTPQANTTVEPEMAIMLPPGYAMLNARLKSTKGTISERLVDYFDHYAEALDEFANAPISAVGYACTGASYLAGVAREDALIAQLEGARPIEVITAASAVVDALECVSAKRIILISPYDDALDAICGEYWRSRGFDVVSRISAYRESDAFHPIYSLGSDAARSGLMRARGIDADAIVMLGTGMPTLRPIAETPLLDGRPVLSCMVCLCWRLLLAAQTKRPAKDNLLEFLQDEGWRERLARIPF